MGGLMENFKTLYESTVSENLEEIRLILEGIEINPAIIPRFEGLLENSCSMLTSKWVSGRKVLRSHFAKQAIKNYPDDILKLSISVDAIINLLDEILDEELDKQTKALHIVELIRALSVHAKEFDKPYQPLLWKYFNKIIVIAIGEEIYKELIQDEEDFEKLILYSIQAYNIRSLVNDIFIELPLIRLYPKLKGKEKVVILAARIHRAFGLMRKDINDIEHDKKNDVSTVMTLLSEKVLPLRSYVEALIDRYTNAINQLRSSNPDLMEIINNFQKMVEDEKAQLRVALENRELAED